MGWGAIISAGLQAAPAIIGGFNAFREGRRAETRAEQDYAAQQARTQQIDDMARQQMRLFDMEYAAREEQRDYYRNMDEINRAILQNERDFDMQRMLRTDAQLASERDFYINRQMDLDRDAAAERARQLQQLINNQMLAASERDVALDELKRAQEIAAGERETDLRNFHEAQFQARAERQFAIEQMEQKRATARAERDFELERRNELENRLTDYGAAMAQLQESFGPARRMRELTDADIDREVGRRRDLVSSAYDRVIDRVSGTNEADLMRRGIQGTDPGDTRARIAARLADDLAMQQMAAEDSAINYLSNEQNLMLSNIQGDYATRDMAYRDMTAGQLAGFNEFAGLLNSTPSANNYNLDVGIGSAVYDRGIQSANQYQAPLAVNSAIYDQAIGSGFGQTLGLPSAVNNQQLRSAALMGPFGSTSFADASYLEAANKNLNTLLAQSTNQYENNMGLADAQDDVVGDAFTSVGNIGSGLLGQLFPGTFGTPEPYTEQMGGTIMTGSGMTGYGRSFGSVYGSK
jgi:hypothetical protein